MKGQAPADAHAATSRVRVGPLAVRGPATFDAKDPTGASDALGDLVANVRARPVVASEEGLPPANAAPLAGAARQGRARLRLPRLVCGHAKAAAVVLTEELLDAESTGEVQLGTPVGAVRPTGMDGRALSAASVAAVRAERPTLGPAVRGADPRPAQGEPRDALLTPIHPPRPASQLAGLPAGLEAAVRRGVEEEASPRQGASAAPVPAKATARRLAALLRAPIQVALGPTPSDVEHTEAIAAVLESAALEGATGTSHARAVGLAPIGPEAVPAIRAPRVPVLVINVREPRLALHLEKFSAPGARALESLRFGRSVSGKDAAAKRQIAKWLRVLHMPYLPDRYAYL